MAKWNGEMDSPPPPTVAARFDQRLADGITAFYASRGQSQKLVAAVIETKATASQRAEEMITDGERKIARLLDELDVELASLAEARSVRAWLDAPVESYRCRTLGLTRPSRRAKQHVGARECVQDLRVMSGVAPDPATASRPAGPGWSPNRMSTTGFTGA